MSSSRWRTLMQRNGISGGRRRNVRDHATRSLIEVLENRAAPGFLMPALLANGGGLQRASGLFGMPGRQSPRPLSGELAWSGFESQELHRTFATSSHSTSDFQSPPSSAPLREMSSQQYSTESLLSLTMRGLPPIESLLDVGLTSFIESGVPGTDSGSAASTTNPGTSLAGVRPSSSSGPSQPNGADAGAPVNDTSVTAGLSFSGRVGRGSGGGGVPQVSISPVGAPDAAAQPGESVTVGVSGPASGADPGDSPSGDAPAGNPAPASETGLTADPKPARGTISLGFHDGLDDWDIEIVGGTPEQAGTIRVGSAILTEGDSFLVSLQRTFVVPENPDTLTFTYTELDLTVSEGEHINDAFEAALVDDEGVPLVHTIGEGRDTYFNVSEEQPVVVGAQASHQPGEISTVSLDISDLTPGTNATLRFQLVNNDTDVTSTVRILDVSLPGDDDPPVIAADLLNDTAPDGPGGDAYRSDRLTNDPRISGSVTDEQGIGRLEASIDGADWLDITDSLNNGQFVFDPGLVVAGAHTITIRATNTRGQSADQPVSFTMNSPPIPDAGGDRTIDEGTTVTFDGSSSGDLEGPLFAWQWEFHDGSGAATVTASRTYPDDGTHPVSLTVTDTAGSVVTQTVNVSVRNVMPTVSVASRAGDEGVELAIEAGGFTDPGFDNPAEGTVESFIATIDWGDGTPVDSGDLSVTQGSPGVLSTGTVSGSHTYADDGLYDVTVTVTDDDGGSQSRTFQISVNNLSPVVLVGPLSQSLQYSDSVQPVVVAATDVPDDVLTVQTSYRLNGGAAVAGLPAGLTLNGSGGQGAGNWTLSGTFGGEPGSYEIEFRVSDEDGGFAPGIVSLEILPEDAAVNQTSVAYVSTGSTEAATAIVPLRATISDITAIDPTEDSEAGVITNATASFVNRDTGVIIAADLPITLVDAGDTKVGVVSYLDWEVNLGNADSESYTIGVIVGGYYTRDSSADNTVIIVTKPSDGFVTGGGYILNDSSVGQYHGDPGLKTNFGFNVKYNKKKTNLQGHANIIVRQQEATYQFKSNRMDSLVVDPVSGTAVILGKANLRDITDPWNPISITGNLSFEMTVTDLGEPGDLDLVAITVWDGSELYYSSHWNGAQTVLQQLDGGNIQLHNTGNALHATSSPFPGNSGAKPLDAATLQTMAAAAIERLESAGLKSQQSADLWDVKLQLTDLTGSRLGEALDNTILIDMDAGGQGWFVDATPHDDVEFSAATSAPIGIDLLSVITHEFGHIAGFEHTYTDGDWMRSTLQPGQRSLPHHLDETDGHSESETHDHAHRFLHLGGQDIHVANPGSHFESGERLVLNGTAKAHGNGNSISLVTMNGVPVDVLDVGGNFFANVTIQPGENEFTFTALDTLGFTVSETLVVTGVGADGADPVFDIVSDVTGSFIGEYGRTSFNTDTDILCTDLMIRNDGGYPADVPLLVGVTNISDPTVRVRDFDGTTPDGIRYFDFTELAGNTTPAPGEATAAQAISFFNPERVQFTYDLVFFGRLNTAPAINSVPDIEALQDRTYRYDVDATDPDGDILTYALTAAPAGMQIDATTGVITWNPTTDDLGLHDVTVRVADGRGGSTEQRYVLSTIVPPPNRPPRFTSTPIVDVPAGAPYLYDADAVDPDGDALTYSIQTYRTRPIEIGNPGFEDVALGDGARGSIAPAWVVYLSGQPWDGATFGYNPRFDETHLGLVPEGQNVARLPTGFTFFAQQTLSESLRADTTYTLEFDVARSGRGSGGSVQLRAGGSVLASHSLVGTQVDRFSTFSIQYTVAADDPRIGSQLSILLTPPFSDELYFDDFSLTATGFQDGPPDGASFDPNTGELDWSPSGTDVGERLVKLTVDDGRGGVAEQAFEIAVHPAQQNRAPQIVSAPNTEAIVYTTTVFHFVGSSGGAAAGSHAGYYDQQPNTRTAFLQSLTLPTAELADFAVYHLASPTFQYDALQTLLDRGGNILFIGENSTFFSGQNATINSALFALGSSMSLTTPSFDAGAHLTTRAAGRIIDHPLTQGVNVIEYAAPCTITGAAPENELIFGDDGEGPLFAYEDVGNGTIFLLSDSNVIESFRVGGSLQAEIDNDRLLLNLLEASRKEIPAYEYQVEAIDPDGDSLTFELVDAPAGMTIDPQTGVIHWTVTHDALIYGNEVPVRLRVTDGLSNAEQVFEISFALPGRGRLEGVLFEDENGDGIQGTTESPVASHTVFIDDNNNGHFDRGEWDAVTNESGEYVFENLPDGAYLLRTAARSGWRVTEPDEEFYQVALTDGATITGLNFGTEFVGDNDNRHPEFMTEPPVDGIVGNLFGYAARAEDADFDILQYSLEAHPSGMWVRPSTGDIFWYPTNDQLGTHDVLLSVRDGRGGVDLQSFQVTVTGNTAPAITSTPRLQAETGLPYQYRVRAQDADGDALSYHLNQAPAGLTIDSATGVISWASPTQGSHAVGIVVDDGQGGTAAQSFTLNVVPEVTNEPPVIESTPVTTAVIGQPYRYRVTAGDPNGDPISYSLLTAPAGMIIDSFGLISWLPTAAQLGSHSVSVQVDDGRGESDTQQFSVNVVDQRVNGSPQITSNPPFSVVFGQDYTYDAQASDPDGDPLVWSLLNAPTGMSIDAETGTVRWSPSSLQIGQHAVEIEVLDGRGGSATQSVAVDVRSVNTPPQIRSTPPTGAFVGRLYTYAVSATDPDGQALQYAIGGPPAMTIDPATGLIQWTPTVSDVGTHSLVVVVSDGLAQVRQTFDVQVTSEVPNSWPVITSTPKALATVDQLYQYDLIAADADGDDFTFSLTEFPAGMTLVNGNTLQWTPTADQVGPHTVTVLATDVRGGVGGQRFTITAAINDAPTIVSEPVLTISAGARYRYDVRAVDPNGDAVTYALVSAPSGITIDDLGRIEWSPGDAEIGDHPIEIVVQDQRGGEDRQLFTLTVTTDQTVPQVLVTLSENPVDIGGQVDILVTAVDDVGVDVVQLTADGMPVVLDGNGRAILSVSTAGLITLRGTATDRSGNVGAHIVELTVVDPADVSDPVVAISSPEYNATIEGPVDVIGTVTDDSLLYYTLSIARFEGGEFVEIARGTEPVTDGVLGQFDPSLLSNDSYFLQLYAVDAGGNESVEQILISVAGELKIGNFTLSFTDLSIPVSGIPITVARTYDSLNAGTSGDFGYGWRMEFSDTDLRTSVARTGAEDDLIYNPFFDGARVFVTLPGGQREGFTFRLTPAPGYAGSILGIFEGRFVPDAGVTSSLTTEAATLRVTEFGEAVDYSTGLPWHPASPAFGGTYTLTTLEGIRYTIDGDSGDLQQVADRNGNTLSFSDSGILSSTGQSVTFERDPRGRITAVIDPAGNRVEYAYDANGDLSAVTDRNQNTTTLGYEEPQRPHYLTTIVDPLGRTGIRSEYDDRGRLTSMVDADGNVVELVHDPDNDVEVVRNQLGHATAYEYDERGNVLTETDAEGGVTKRTYDLRNNTLSEIVIIGEDDQTTTNPDDPADLATYFTYDTRGSVLTETDALGHVTFSTYDSFGNVLTTTDPLGNTTTNVYDGNNNLLSITDPAGQVTAFTYDASGNPLTMSLPGGNTQSFTYDTRGNVLTQTDALGHTTLFTYDANGNQLSETRTQTTAAGLRTIRTETEYDAGGRVRFTRMYEDGVLQRASETRYDAVGNRVEQIDPLGRSTHFMYDDRGLLVETIYPDDTPADLTDNPRTRTEYDAAGQPVAEIDAAGRRTVSVYDRVGRVVEVISPDDTPADLTDNPRTRTEYDEAGRVVAQIDALGNRTEFEFDAAGRQILTRDALGHVMTTTYDSAGRQQSVTDPLGYITQFVYDDAGRPVETILPGGSRTRSVFDDAGRLASRIDQAGRATDYEYDALGRLTAVVLPEVDDPLTATRVRPRTEYEYDELGSMTVQRDALGRETRFQYDGQGRRVATILPEGQRSAMDYDPAGNVISTTDFNGDTIEFTYDARNRLVTKHYPDSTETSYTYTVTGQVESVTDSRGVTVFAYGAQDRLVSRIDPDNTPADDSDNAHIGYTYDLAGNRTSVSTIVPGNVPRMTSYTFDALNRIATVTDPEGDETTYSYDDASRLVRTDLPNGTYETREYDSQHRLLEVAHHDATDAVFSSFAYELDDVGNRTAITEQDGRRVEYGYDELDRLVNETIRDAGSSAVSRAIDYTYDTVGNRLTRTDSAEGLTEYTCDDNDRLLTEMLTDLSNTETETLYTYDNNGNTLSKTGLTDHVFYDWDFDNRLISADTNGDGTPDATYEYDANGIRVSKTEGGVTTNFLIDANRPYAQVLEEYTPGGIIQVSYIHGLDLISQYRPGETGKSFYHVDGLGSTRNLSDALGNLTDHYIYDAFGRTIGQVGSTGNVYLFAGEQRDAAIGLDYLRARYMSPGAGRFLSRDAFEGFGVKPISLHDFQYADANPVNNVDPTGNYSLAGLSTSVGFVTILDTFLLPIALKGLNLALASIWIGVGSQFRYLGQGMIAYGAPNGDDVYKQGNELISLAARVAESADSGIDLALQFKGIGDNIVSLVKPPVFIKETTNTDRQSATAATTEGLRRIEAHKAVIRKRLASIVDEPKNVVRVNYVRDISNEVSLLINVYRDLAFKYLL